MEDDELRDLSDFNDEEKAGILESWKSQSHERAMQLANIPVALDCVRMVANALLYLNQYPEDIADSYQAGFPKAFREKIERSDGKTKDRTLSRARSAGFTVIKQVGGIFERTEAMEQGDSPSPHLRRAHWRRQVHGPQNSLRKLIWIRVVKVLGGAVRDRPYLIVDGKVS